MSTPYSIDDKQNQFLRKWVPCGHQGTSLDRRETRLVNAISKVFGWHALNSSVSTQLRPTVPTDWDKAEPIVDNQVDSVRLRAWQS